jgi:hypothetical protein
MGRQYLEVVRQRRCRQSKGISMNTSERSSIQNNQRSQPIAPALTQESYSRIRQYQGLSKSTSKPAPTFAEIGSSSGSMLKKSDGMSKSLKSGMAKATSRVPTHSDSTRRRPLDLSLEFCHAVVVEPDMWYEPSVSLVMSFASKRWSSR